MPCIFVISLDNQIIKVYELGGAILILYVGQLRFRDLTRLILGMALCLTLNSRTVGPSHGHRHVLTSIYLISLACNLSLS